MELILFSVFLAVLGVGAYLYVMHLDKKETGTTDNKTAEV